MCHVGDGLRSATGHYARTGCTQPIKPVQVPGGVAGKHPV